MRRRCGQSILYVILLMPAMLVILSLTVDIGQLQFQRLRLRNALDLATLSGAASVDRSYYAETGRLRLDPGVAIVTTRSYLQRNLVEALGEQQATYVADAAQISIVNVTPGVDPF
ncbi:MAG TPA: Tad domain-containing protein, partial [Candidatus Dormibacteraeota bacterium]|nr:Tad domain-containing protein [Candidatus Dormibacteraeota bacterium]